jgi:hypothetical protein
MISHIRTRLQEMRVGAKANNLTRHHQRLLNLKLDRICIGIADICHRQKGKLVTTKGGKTVSAMLLYPDWLHLAFDKQPEDDTNPQHQFLYRSLER